MRFLFIFLIGVQAITAQKDFYHSIPPAKDYHKYITNQIDIDFKAGIKAINDTLKSIDEKGPRYNAYQLWKLRYQYYVNDFKTFEDQLELVNQFQKSLEMELVYDYHAYLYQTKQTKTIDFDKLNKIENKLDSLNHKTNEITGLIYDWIGRSHVDFNNFEKAEQYLQKAIKIFSKNQYERYLSTSYNVLGIVYDGLEDFEKAIKYYRLSTQFSLKAENLNYNNIASAYYNIGLLYSDRLKLADSAVKYYQKAKTFDKLADSISNPYLTYDDIGLSSAYLSLRKLKQAKSYAYSALVNARQNPSLNNYNIQLSHNNLGKLYSVEKQFDSAFSHYEKSKKIIKKVNKDYNQKRWMANVIVSQAEILNRDNRKDEALDLLEKHASSIKSLNRGVFSIPFYDLLFKIYLEQEQYEKAMIAWEQKDDFITNKFDSATYLNIEHQIDLLDFYSEKGLKKQFFEVADAINIKISQPDISKHLEFIVLSKILSFKHEYDLSISTKELIKGTQELIDFIKNYYIKSYFLEDNQYFSEFIQPIIFDFLRVLYHKYQAEAKTKLAFQALELLDTYKTASLTQQQSLRADTDAEVFIEKQNQLNAIQNQIFQLKNQSKSNPEILQKLYRREVELLNDIKRLSTNKTVTNSEFFENLEELKAFQKKISNEHSILSMFKFEDRIFTIHLTNQDIEFNLVEEPVKDFFKKYYQLSAVSQFDTLQKPIQLRSIFGNLKPNKTLILLPDGILGGLAFEALVYDNKKLIKNHQISYVSSLKTLAKKTSEKKSVAALDWMGFAPEYQSLNLKQNRVEVKNISKIVNGEAVVNDKATKTAFRNNVAKSTVMHIAAHGKINNFNPMSSYLAFSDVSDKDNKLRLEEISRYKIPLDLLVLSACESGIGRFNYGDGLMSMGKSFERAGVSASIMTLWEVPDRESEQIMQSFYKYLKQDNTISEALRNAKLEYLKTADDVLLKQPYYWAGFICYGDCDQRFETSVINNQYLWFIIGSVLIIGFLAFSYYKNFRVPEELLWQLRL